jgi:hypothetical protein
LEASSGRAIADRRFAAIVPARFVRLRFNALKNQNALSDELPLRNFAPEANFLGTFVGIDRHAWLHL